MLLLLHAIILCLHTQIVIHLCSSMNSELQTIYVSSVWSHHKQLFTMHHSGYYNLVSFIFGTTIPTSFNILMKCFLHFIYAHGPFCKIYIHCCVLALLTNFILTFQHYQWHRLKRQAGLHIRLIERNILFNESINYIDRNIIIYDTDDNIVDT